MVNLDESSACRGPQEAHAAAYDEARRVAGSAPVNRGATLARVIEADVIPRLLMTGSRAAGAPAGLEVDARDIDDFARMMIEIDLARAGLVVAKATSRGVPVETILLDIFSPVARRLGEMWVDDACTFTDVTVGLCALQSLLRSLSSGDLDEPRQLVDGRVLLAAAPCEQHTFGVLVLETFFRRAGWDVVGMPLCEREDIVASVARKPFDVIGLSLSRDEGVDDLRALVTELRAASRNRDVAVFVGGRVFNERRDLVRAVGADGTASDASEALIASQHHLCSRVRTH